MAVFSFPFRLDELPSDAPESWRLSRTYDRLEVGGERSNPGYVGAYETRAGLALDAVRRHAPAGGRVIDIAAAQGNFSLQLASEGYCVTWNDLRSELGDYVRAKSDLASSMEFVVGNAFDLAEPYSKAYDVVLATEVIEHAAHPDRFLAQMAQLASPDGAIVVTSPNGQYFRNTLPKFSEIDDPSIFEAIQFKPDADGHIFLLWQEEIETLARNAGLQLVEFRLFTNSLTAGHVKLAPLLRVLPEVLVRNIEALTQRLPLPLQRRLNSHWLAVFRRA